MVGSPEDRDVLRAVRIVAIRVVLALIVFVVVMDRIGPILTPEYVSLADTALGLLLGALVAMVGVQGIDLLRGKA